MKSQTLPQPYQTHVPLSANSVPTYGGAEGITKSLRSTSFITCIRISITANTNNKETLFKGFQLPASVRYNEAPLYFNHQV